MHQQRADDAEQRRIEEKIHEDVHRRRTGGAEDGAIARGLLETFLGRVRQRAQDRQQQRADEARDETATAARAAQTLEDVVELIGELARELLRDRGRLGRRRGRLDGFLDASARLRGRRGGLGGSHRGRRGFRRRSGCDRSIGGGRRGCSGRRRGGRTVPTESRREVGGEGDLGMQLARAGEQLLLGLGDLRVGHAAIDRTHGGAGLVIEEADTFGALLGNDVEDVVRDRGVCDAVQLPLDAALVNGGVRALGLTRAAVDALVRNDRRHSDGSFPAFEGLAMILLRSA